MPLVAREKDFLAVEFAKCFLIRAVLGEASNGDDHTVFVGQRPEAFVK